MNEKNVLLENNVTEKSYLSKSATSPQNYSIRNFSTKVTLTNNIIESIEIFFKSHFLFLLL